MKNNLTQDYFNILLAISLVIGLAIIIIWKISKRNGQNIQTHQPKEKPQNAFKQKLMELSQKNNASDESEDENFDFDDEAEALDDENDELTQSEKVEYDLEEEDEPEQEIEDPSGVKLLSVSPIDESRGFYLIRFEDEITLVGYIGDKIFVIKKFEQIENFNLQLRLYEQKKGKATYIVRLDSYKALIEVSENSIELLTEI